MIHLIKKTLYKFPYIKRLIHIFLTAVRAEPQINWKSIDFTELTKSIGKDDPVILDIGCNDGTQTLQFLKHFKKARVYCFEPDPRARERYKNKVKDKRAKLFDIAISDTDGITDFYVSSGFCSEDDKKRYPKGWDESGSIRKPKEHLKLFPWCTFDRKIKVKTKKLDTWCQEEGIDFIDLIWADVQGAEIDLIKGSNASLKNTRYFYTEYGNKELYDGQINLRELLKLLPDFKVVHRYPQDILLINTKLNKDSR